MTPEIDLEKIETLLHNLAEVHAGSLMTESIYQPTTLLFNKLAFAALFATVFLLDGSHLDQNPQVQDQVYQGSMFSIPFPVEDLASELGLISEASQEPEIGPITSPQETKEEANPSMIPAKKEDITVLEKEEDLMPIPTRDSSLSKLLSSNDSSLSIPETSPISLETDIIEPCKNKMRTTQDGINDLLEV